MADPGGVLSHETPAAAAPELAEAPVAEAAVAEPAAPAAEAPAPEAPAGEPEMELISSAATDPDDDWVPEPLPAVSMKLGSSMQVLSAALETGEPPPAPRPVPAPAPPPPPPPEPDPEPVAQKEAAEPAGGGNWESIFDLGDNAVKKD